VLPADLRAALGFVEGSILVAYIEGEGRLVIESPEAIERALLREWSGVASIATDIFARDRRHVLSLADRCCLATATRLGLPAITDDPAWSSLDLGARIVTFR
jgi:PIN domain nuclease of toxin-antitoxin system